RDAGGGRQRRSHPEQAGDRRVLLDADRHAAPLRFRRLPGQGGFSLLIPERPGVRGGRPLPAPAAGGAGQPPAPPGPPPGPPPPPPPAGWPGRGRGEGARPSCPSRRPASPAGRAGRGRRAPPSTQSVTGRLLAVAVADRLVDLPLHRIQVEGGRVLHRRVV